MTATSPSGPAGRYHWVPWTVAGIAAAAGVLYLVAASSPNLHNYYTPAVVSMSESLHNFIYGAYDTAGWSGVDKIPGSLWPQALSVAVFGASAWSVLIPEVLATVATIVILYLAAARWRGRIAGLAAAAVYATMPLAAALAKSNVPEVWFALAISLAGYFMIRALQSGRFWWLLATGLAVSAAFQVKMLEAWMLYPAIAIAYLATAPRGIGTRLWHTVVAGLLSIAASLWWIVLVSLTPATDRPWVGGTSDNSAWSMVFGYNGFGRVTGGEGAFVADFAGDPGLARLVGDQIAVDVAWFLPLALAATVVGFCRAIRPRSIGSKAVLGGYAFFGLWLVIVTAIMALSAGIHTFYVLALAPAIAVLVGALAQEGWDALASRTTRIVAAGLVAAQTAWTVWLVVRADAHGWLLVAVPALSLLAIVVMAMGRRTGLTLAGIALLLAPATWTIGSLGAANPINPSASSVSSMGGPAGAGPGAATTGDRMPTAPPAGGPGRGPGDGPGGAASFNDATASVLRDWLLTQSPDTRYLVAADSQTSGQLALAETPGVITLGGGFNGSDPTPTADDLARLVAGDDLRFVVVDQQRGGRGPDDTTSTVTAERTTWITEHCTVVTDAPVTSGTVYDCAAE